LPGAVSAVLAKFALLPGRLGVPVPSSNSED